MQHTKHLCVYKFFTIVILITTLYGQSGRASDLKTFYTVKWGSIPGPAYHFKRSPVMNIGNRKIYCNIILGIGINERENKNTVLKKV